MTTEYTFYVYAKSEDTDWYEYAKANTPELAVEFVKLAHEEFSEVRVHSQPLDVSRL